MQSTLNNSYPSVFAVELASICIPKALQFFSFTLGQEKYGIDSQKMQELRGCDADRITAGDEMGLIEKLAA